MQLNISLPDLSEQIKVMNNFTNMPSDPSNISQAGWFYPVYLLYHPMADLAWLLVIMFTVGIVTIKTQSLPAVAFVTLLLAGMVTVFVPAIGGKIAYLVAIFAIAATLWLVFGKR